MRGLIEELNKNFESRIRLGIMSTLMVNTQIDFNALKDLLKVTDGNLASHIKALEKLEYITITKKFIGKKPNTTYSSTPLGKQLFTKHINALENLIKGK